MMPPGGRGGSRTTRSAVALKKGDRKQVQFQNAWYDSEILDVGADGSTCTVRYDEGGDEEGEIDVATRVREIPPPIPLKTGQKMEVLCEGTWYESDILDVSKDGETCKVKYDEGGEEEADIEVRKRVRALRVKFADLTVGQKFAGRVRSIMPFGAFVDIGAERDGLVHVSRMANERVNDVNQYVSEGQEVDVWVAQITDDGKLGLAMLESKIGGGGGGPRAAQDFTAFEKVSPDEWLSGKVARIAPFGLFVSVTAADGSSADGLVHITQIRDGFVESTENEAEVGQEIKVRVTRVDAGAGRMSLTMKDGDSGGGGGGGGRAPQGDRAPADLSAFGGISSSEWLHGKVARVAPFGLFVTVSTPDGKATADGLVHITQIRDGFVESTESEAKVGQEVDVRVLSVDAGVGKMSLSMKSDG